MFLIRDIQTFQNGRFKVGPSFKDVRKGRVCVGLNLSTDIGVAIKIELENKRNGTLRREIRIYDALCSQSPRPGVVPMLFAGTLGFHRYLVLDRLGLNLEQYRHQCEGKTFSLKSTLMVGMRAVRALRSVHEAGVVHCSIQPRNLIMGRYDHDESCVYVIDFSDAGRYFGARVQIPLHGSIPYAVGVTPKAVTPFSSVSCDRGLVRSRRDDLESLVYTLVFLFKGRLPWSDGISAASGIRKREENIASVKDGVSLGELCEGFPIEVGQFFETVRKIATHKRPPYDLLVSLLENAFFRLGYKDDCVFDWTPSFEEFPPGRGGGIGQAQDAISEK